MAITLLTNISENMKILNINNDLIEYKSIELLEEYLVLPFLNDETALEIVKTIDLASPEYISMTFNQFSNNSIVDMELFYNKLRYLQYAYPENPHAASVEKKVLEEKSYFSLPIHDIGEVFHYVSNDFIGNFIDEKNIPKHPLIILYEQFVEHIQQYIIDQDYKALAAFWNKNASYLYPEDTRMRQLFEYDFKEFPSDDYDSSENVAIAYNVYYITLKDLRRQSAILLTEHFIAQPENHVALAKEMPGFFDFSCWLEHHEQCAFACRFTSKHVQSLSQNYNQFLGQAIEYISNIFCIDNVNLHKYAYSLLNIAQHKDVLLPLFQIMCRDDDYVAYWKDRLAELSKIMEDSFYDLIATKLNEKGLSPNDSVSDIVAYANTYPIGAKNITHHAIDLLGCIISWNKTPHNIALDAINELYKISQQHTCLYLLKNSDYKFVPNLKIDELYSSLEYMNCCYPKNTSIMGLLKNLNDHYVSLINSDNVVDYLWDRVHSFSFPDARLYVLEQYMNKHNISAHPLVQKNMEFLQDIDTLHTQPENMAHICQLWDDNIYHASEFMHKHNELNTGGFIENTSNVKESPLDNKILSRIYRLQIRFVRYKIEESLFRYFVHYPELHSALTKSMPPFFAFNSHLQETQKLSYMSLCEQHHIDALVNYKNHPGYHIFIMGTFRIGKYATHSQFFLDIAKRSDMFDPLFIHIDISGNSLKGFLHSYGPLSINDEKALKEIENVFIMESYEKMQKELPTHGQHNKRSKI